MYGYIQYTRRQTDTLAWDRFHHRFDKVLLNSSGVSVFVRK